MPGKRHCLLATHTARGLARVAAQVKGAVEEEAAKIQVENIRNIGISAHVDSGKTTVTERLLYYTGRIDSIHDVRGKDGVGAKMDSMELERQRGITIKSAATCMEWKGTRLNLIDTPGHVDFTIEVERSLRVLDGAVLVLCASGGVQSQTFTVNKQMKRYDVPFISFINKLDRLGACPYSVLAQMRQKLMMNAAMLQIPIGAEREFEAVIDVLEGKALYFEGYGGETMVEKSFPVSYEEEVIKRRQDLVECLSNVDEEVGELYCMGEDISNDQIRQGIKRTVLNRTFTPVLIGSALKNKGVQPLLDNIIQYLPNPTQVSNYALRPDTEEKVLMDPTRTNKTSACALAFKLEQGVYGQLTYMRVYQGCLKRGQMLVNTRTGKTQKVPKLVIMHSNEQQEVEEGLAGDIVAMLGVDCASGDTFVAHDAKERLTMESIYVPEPVVTIAIKPTDKTKEGAFAKALDRFQREDPTFKVEFDHESKDMLIKGMGELHLEIYAERIRREYDCPCVTGQPKVNYRESILDTVEFDHIYKRQSGGKGQYGRIAGRIELNEESEFDFVNNVRGGAIPKNYFGGIRKGIEQIIKEGVMAGHPITGIRVIIEDGAYHDVDSSDYSFNRTAYHMMEETIPKSGVLLEPFMELEVNFPAMFTAAVEKGLLNRRADLKGTLLNDGYSSVHAVAPLADMFGYMSELRSQTQGKGEYSMTFDGYRPVADHIAVELVEAFEQAKLDKAAEKLKKKKKK